MKTLMLATAAVLSGEVEVQKKDDLGNQVPIATLRAGDVFGEIALLDGKERTADATAATDCELLIVPRRSLFSPAAYYSRRQRRSPSDHQKLALSSNVYVEHADHLQVRYRQSVREMRWQKRNSSA
jgi:CRP-like cAMP-binding protein